MNVIIQRKYFSAAAVVHCSFIFKCSWPIKIPPEIELAKLNFFFGSHHPCAYVDIDRVLIKFLVLGFDRCCWLFFQFRGVSLL